MTEAAWIGFGAIIATFVGPVAAVLMTRYIDRRREEYRRRLDLFRILMRSRRTSLSLDFVGGLNLIEVEFFDDAEVLKAWRALLEDLDRPVPTTPADDARVMQKRDYLRAVLLSQIAKSLRFNIPDLEIFRGGYSPQGHLDAETEQMINRKFFVEIAKGTKAFPVVAFPPPPDWKSHPLNPPGSAEAPPSAVP